VITLDNGSNYVFLFTIAAVAGLIGGLAAELLLSRNGETGAFELPARKDGLFDLGGFAPLIIGAVVGVAILIVFPPQTTIVTNAAGGTTTTFQAYDTVRLVATSLVAGSAGGSVLSALQSRVTAAVNESRVQFAVTAGEQQLEQLRQSAAAEAGERIRGVATAMAAAPLADPGGARPRGALGDMPPPDAAAARDAAVDEAIDSLNASLDRQVAQGRAAIGAAARTRGKG